MPDAKPFAVGERGALGCPPRSDVCSRMAERVHPRSGHKLRYYSEGNSIRPGTVDVGCAQSGELESSRRATIVAGEENVRGAAQ